MLVYYCKLNAYHGTMQVYLFSSFPKTKNHLKKQIKKVYERQKNTRGGVKFK